MTTANTPSSRLRDAGGAGEWWRNGVVYQIWPRSFADGNGDGVGDLRGVIERLDHLAWLGVDALWLSPIYPSPMVDGGYDVADYTDIHPDFGTLADFDELVAQAHRRDVRVILDLVVNHTSDQHSWFLESRRGPASPRRSWYFWRPPRPGHVGGTPGAEPNNWASHFGGSAWQWDPATGEYYLHLYDVSQPDLDWSNADVRHAVHDVLRFWLARGVDGFRMDVITKIAKHPDLPDAVAEPGSSHAMGTRYYLDRPEVHDHLRELRAEVLDESGPRPVTIGEAWLVPIDVARSYTDPASRELDMIFSFDHVQLDRGKTMFDVRPLEVRRLLDTLASWQRGLGAEGWAGLYWGNHDQPRALSRFGDAEGYPFESATLLLTVLFCLRGTPFLYQGEEIGMTDPGAWSAGELRDVSAIGHLRAGLAAGRPEQELLAEISAAGRDNARTPMRWDDTAHGGFSAVQPWIRASDDGPEVSVAAQRKAPRSVLGHTRRLVELRHGEPALRIGNFVELLPDHPTAFVFLRPTDGEQILVAAQWAAEPTVVQLPQDGLAGSVTVLGNYEPAAAVESDGRLRLRPWEVVVARVSA